MSKNTALNNLFCFLNQIKTLDISSCEFLVNITRKFPRKHDEKWNCDYFGKEDELDRYYIALDPEVRVVAGDFISEPTAGTENPISEKPGDINGDSVIDGRDVLRLMKYLAGEEDPETGNPIEVFENNADVDGSGIIDEKDLLRLVRYLAGEDVKLLPGAASGNG